MVYGEQIASALGQLRRACGVPVTYQRGTVSLSLTAIHTTQLLRLSDTEGRTFLWRSTDWLLAAADLGELQEPQIGDRLTAQFSSGARTFEVVEKGDEPCFRWSDPSRTQYRIHTEELR